MRALPNELAVKALFAKVCERYQQQTEGGKEYVPMTDYEIEHMMEKVIGPKREAGL